MTSTDINDQRMSWPFRLANALWSFKLHVPASHFFTSFFFRFCNEDGYINDICFSWKINFSENRSSRVRLKTSPFLTSSSALFTWSRSWNHKAKRRLNRAWTTYIEMGLKHSSTSCSRNEHWIRSLLAVGWIKEGGRGKGVQIAKVDLLRVSVTVGHASQVANACKMWTWLSTECCPSYKGLRNERKTQLVHMGSL